MKLLNKDTQKAIENGYDCWKLDQSDLVGGITCNNTFYEDPYNQIDIIPEGVACEYGKKN